MSSQHQNPREPIHIALSPIATQFIDISPTIPLPTVTQSNNVPARIETITRENVNLVNELSRWKIYWKDFAFSPDGTTVATCNYDDSDRTLRLWDSATGQLLFVFEGHNERVASVAFSPDGMLIASGSTDGIIRLWDVKNRSLIRSLEGGIIGVNSLAFSPNGQLLASGNSDNAGNLVQLWNPNTGDLIFTFKDQPGYVNSVAFSPDGQILASGGEDNTVKLWNVANGQFLRQLATRMDGVQYASYKGSHLLGGRALGVSSVAFGPDGNTLVSGGEDGKVLIWNAQDGKIIQTIISGNWVNSIAYSRDGLILAVGTDDPKIQLWDVSNGKLLRDLVGHTAAIERIAFSPDGKFLFSSSYRDNTVMRWALHP